MVWVSILTGPHVKILDISLWFYWKLQNLQEMGTSGKKWGQWWRTIESDTGTMPTSASFFASRWRLCRDYLFLPHIPIVLCSTLQNVQRYQEYYVIMVASLIYELKYSFILSKMNLSKPFCHNDWSWSPKGMVCFWFPDWCRNNIMVGGWMEARKSRKASKINCSTDLNN